MINWNEEIKTFMARPDMVELKNKITELRKTKTIFPDSKNIYNAFKLCPYEKVRVVILGQDVYHTKGVAHGLAFSTLQKQTPPSLLNIFKEIHRSCYYGQKYENLFTSNDLTSWATQGVLLLNTILTVEEGLPNSHKGFGWEKLTEHVIRLLNNHERPLVFMLWGNNAKEWKSIITNPKHYILESVHPSPLSAEKGFNGCNHFSLCNDFLHYQGEYFLNLSDCIDYEKMRSKSKEKMKAMGMKPDQWKVIKADIDGQEVWAKMFFGVFLDGYVESFNNQINWKT